MKHQGLIESAALLLALSTTAHALAQQTPREPHTYFREYVKLTDGEIRDIDSGKVVAKTVDTGEKPEVALFGAVYIRAPMESFVSWFRDPSRFAGMDSYIAYGTFSDPPQLSDVADLTLDEKDFEALPKCSPGDCELQLPVESMERFKENVDWSSPDAAKQVNALLREGALRLINSYKKGGNAALGVYQDKDYDLAVDATFETLLSRAKGLSAYLPELVRYLLDYPNATLSDVEESFHWEHVNFGLRPTLRAIHVILYRPAELRNEIFVAVDKQLYASHYFQVAADFWIGVKDSANPDADGFYLITLKGSRQHGLTGFKGGIVRGPLVSRARSSLETVLAAIRQNLEAGAR